MRLRAAILGYCLGLTIRILGGLLFWVCVVALNETLKGE